jgi:hypothetical protein
VSQVGEFRTLFVNMTVLMAGDQFARGALSLPVFDRTRSAATPFPRKQPLVSPVESSPGAGGSRRDLQAASHGCDTA